MLGQLDRLLRQDVDLGAAFRWWTGELADLASGVWAGRQRTTLVLHETGDGGWLVARETSSGLAPLAALAAATSSRDPVAVLLPASAAFRKIIRLPAEAERDLDAIVRFELARQTPLTVDRAYLRHRIVGRAPFGIEVELTVAAREPVDTLLRLAAARGLRVESVTMADVPPSERRRRSLVPRPDAGWTGVDVGLLAVAIAASLAAPLAIASFRLAALDREIAELRPAVEASLADRQRGGAAAQRTAEIVAAARSGPAALDTLTALTRAIPDGTWLSALQIAGREVAIDGFSPNAAQLPRLLETMAGVERVDYRAPIARDPATGLEQFHFGVVLARTKR